MAQSDGITTAILLEQMQGMEERLCERIGRVEGKVVELKTTVDRNHVLTMTQLDMIDGRLDDIECVQVPTLKKAVGLRS